MIASLSAFFPCYNEEENIEKLVTSVCTTLPKIAKKFEIIVVDDGSSDKTKKIVQRLQKQCPDLRIVSHAQNSGYGAAIKTGIKSASKNMDWVFWMDGDLQFDITSLDKFLQYTREYDAIIGYRAHRADTFLRKVNGELYTRLINFLFHMNIKDIYCAFKLIRKDKLDEVHIETSSAFTSSEILIKLKSKGAKFKQLPVAHYPRMHGKPTGGSFAVILKGLNETVRFYFHSKQMA